MEALFEYVRRKVEDENKYCANNPYLQQVKERDDVLVLYGAGSVGHAVYNYLHNHGVKTDFFCSGINGGYIDRSTGKYVLTKEDLKKYENAMVILTIGDTASEQEKEEICNAICEMGIKRERIFRKGWFESKTPYREVLQCFDKIKQVYDMLADDISKEVYKRKLYYMVEYIPVDFQEQSPMYMGEKIIQFDESEVIIDGGAWIGDTAELFLEKIGRGCKVYSFEPDKRNYEKLKENMKEKTSVVVENFGLWDSEQVLCFAEEGNGSSHIQNDDDATRGETITTVDIDTYCKRHNIKPTYIKMDIEGAEYKALCGAERVINERRPKLAICIYHKFEDYFTLPLLIKKLNTNYKLYVRHYSDCEVDTIIYAI